MKRIIIFPAILLFIAVLMISCGSTSGTSSSSNRVTTSFFTDGVCDMCEDRIEEALLVKGVYSVSWDKYAKTTTVEFSEKHISEEELHRLAAEAGHDTDKVKATEAAYNSIPACCRYKELETH